MRIVKEYNSEIRILDGRCLRGNLPSFRALVRASQNIRSTNLEMIQEI